MRDEAEVELNRNHLQQLKLKKNGLGGWEGHHFNMITFKTMG